MTTSMPMTGLYGNPLANNNTDAHDDSDSAMNHTTPTVTLMMTIPKTMARTTTKTTRIIPMITRNRFSSQE
jgi:hypothetical protein